MPRLLAARCTRDDCIAEFRASALLRYQEGLTLEVEGHRTAAIYLWGYAAEMILKAAYFAVAGFRDTAPIKASDLRTATTKTALLCGLAWISNWHNVFCWSVLVVRYRSHLGLAYADPNFGSIVMAHASAIHLRWRETLWYHSNLAYRHEVERARDATRWFIENSGRL